MTSTPSPVTSPKDPTFTSMLPYVSFTAVMFFFCYLDRAIFGPLLPMFEEEFSLSHAQSTRYLLYISVGYAAGVLLSGLSASVIKSRYLAGGAVVGTGFVLLLMALVPGKNLLALLFTLLGIVAGQYFNGGMGTLRSLVSVKYWGVAISIHELGPGLSFVLSPLLAQLAMGVYGWRGVVTGMGCLSIVMGTLYIFTCKGGLQTTEKISLGGVRRVFKNPRFWLFSWLMGISIAGEFAPFGVLMMHLTEDRLLSFDNASYLLSASKLIAPVAVLFGGWMTYRFGSRRALFWCMTSHAIAMFMLASPWFLVMTIGLFVQPMVTALSFPPIFTLLVEVFPAKDQSLLLSIGMPISGLIGTGIMPSALGLWGSYGYFTVGFAMMGILLLAALPLLRYMHKPDRPLME